MYKMKCGHVGVGICNGKPVCPICYPQSSLGAVIDKEVHGNEGLEGRMAQCLYCRSKTLSSWALPFFEYTGDRNQDSYYCGCRGWD